MIPQAPDPLSRPSGRYYEFGEFLLDTGARLLLRQGNPVPLTPQTLDTLTILVENRGRVVTKEELMQRIWPDSFVEETGLTRNISVLRKTLGENPREHRYIVTVPGQGYEFVAGVRELPDRGSGRLLTERTRTRIVLTEQSDDPLAGRPLPDGVGGRNLIPEAPALLPSSSRVEKKRMASRPAVVVTGALLLATAVLVVWLLIFKGNRSSDATSPRPETLRMTVLTATGNAGHSTLSSDGKFAVYALNDSPSRSSLWIRHLSSLSGTQLIPPAEIGYSGLTVSPDGSYIYYVTVTPSRATALHKMAPLGGPSKKILDDLDSRVSFSPDGKRFVFRRSHSTEYSLIVANEDGSGQREIARVGGGDSFGTPSWSPSGKVIACAVGRSDGGRQRYVVEVTVDDWVLKPLTSKRWRWIGDMAWLPDSSGLFMIAADDPADSYQVWRLPYPEGEAQQITSTSTRYVRLSATGDASALLVQENDRAASVWTVPADSPENAKQIAYGIGGFRGDLSWAPDGRIVFESANAGASDLSIMNPDGSQQTPLLGDMIEKAITVDPAVSRDGRFIFFGSDLEGVRNIWRIDRDGSNPTRLTHGGGEDQPQSSPDGRWLVYRDISAGTSGLCKVAMEGGEPVRISDTIASNPSVSPDGRLVAAFRAHEETASLRLALFSIDGGPPVRIFPQPVRNLAVIRWTRDGKFISYVDTIDGVSNIELQPVEGGQPVRFTNFRSDVIFGFDWSADGRQLACVRGIWKNNLVLISGLR